MEGPEEGKRPQGRRAKAGTWADVDQGESLDDSAGPDRAAVLAALEELCYRAAAGRTRRDCAADAEPATRAAADHIIATLTAAELATCEGVDTARHPRPVGSPEPSLFDIT
ncbi:hypothetical protein [Nocardia asiatica]|uniref:hypothetical protein n=1 Tax=Nocardia asiatica TaxID=209252 RepID=UPI003EDFC6A5